MKQARCKNKLEKYNPETDSIIISVKEARKILGKEMSDKLSDEDLVMIIGLLHEVAESLLDFAMKQNKKTALSCVLLIYCMVISARVSPSGYSPSAGELCEFSLLDSDYQI